MIKTKYNNPDGHILYPEIIEEIGAKHHNCTFHIMQRLMIPLQKLQNKRNRSIKSFKEQIEKTTEKNRRIKKQNTPREEEQIK